MSITTSSLEVFKHVKKVNRHSEMSLFIKLAFTELLLHLCLQMPAIFFHLDEIGDFWPGKINRTELSTLSIY